MLRFTPHSKTDVKTHGMVVQYHWPAGVTQERYMPWLEVGWAEVEAQKLPPGRTLMPWILANISIQSVAETYQNPHMFQLANIFTDFSC